MELSTARRLACVLAAAAGLRLWQGVVQPVNISFDTSEYATLAEHLVRDRTLSYDGKAPSAFRLPLYPFAIAAVTAGTGRVGSPWPPRAMNLGFSLATVVLVFLLARRALPEPWALGAALLMGLNPEHGQLDWTLGPEPVFTFQFALAALLAQRVLEEPGRAGRWLALGADLGASLLTRSTLLAWPPACAALLCLARPAPGSLRRAAALLAVCYACVVPWVLRNAALFGRVIPFEDGMGWHMLWQSTTSVEGIRPDDKLPQPLRTYFFTKDPRIGPASRALALDSIKADPLRYAGLCAGRLRVLWFQGAWAERALAVDAAFSEYLAARDWKRAGAKAAFKFLEFAVLACALGGLAVSWARPEGRLLALQLLYMNIHVFTMGLPRYTAPAFPLTALFAAVGLHAAWARARTAA